MSSNRAKKMVALALKQLPNDGEVEIATSSFLNINDMLDNFPYELEVECQTMMPNEAFRDNGEAFVNKANLFTDDFYIKQSIITELDNSQYSDIAILTESVVDNLFDTSEHHHQKEFLEELEEQVSLNNEQDILEEEQSEGQEIPLDQAQFGEQDTGMTNEYEDDPTYTPQEEELQTEEDILDDVQEEILAEKENVATIRKRKRNNNLKGNKSWDKNINKRKRMLGEEYTGYTRSKDGIVKHNIKRCKRELGPKCNSNFCQKARNRYCNLLLEEERCAIFKTFWDMSWEQKRLYILHMTSYDNKKRCYIKEPSRRNGSFEYFLKVEKGKFQVCKKTFLATLGIKERMVRHWVNKENTLFGTQNKQDEINKEKSRKKSLSTNSIEQKEKIKNLHEFLESLPKIESHYCRKDTNKLYFEQDFKSKSDVYHLYKKNCLDRDVIPLSICTFMNQFNGMNLAIFKPRKDQCDLCSSYKMKQVSEITYKEHILAKDKVREEKTFDKERAAQQIIHCFTMDVQAVMLCPQLKASALYYKTKLQVHNFTIYNLSTNASTNFVWNETQGELCSSVFVTCIVKFLEDLLKTDPKPIVLYSDSCGYQNKNVILSNALSMLATKYNTQIEQKFLEKGHTQMECDSSHSLIERRLKGRDIFLPTDYINIIKDARKKPMPLEVVYLDYTYFLNFEDPELMRYSSIRPGKGTGELKVTDVRALKYVPTGEIFFKTNFDYPYNCLPQRQKVISVKNYNPTNLYDDNLKINKKKWLNLQQLKHVLPKDTHYFYNSIQYYEKDDDCTNNQKKPDKIKKLQKNNNQIETNNNVENKSVKRNPKSQIQQKVVNGYGEITNNAKETKKMSFGQHENRKNNQKKADKIKKLPKNYDKLKTFINVETRSVKRNLKSLEQQKTLRNRNGRINNKTDKKQKKLSCEKHEIRQNIQEKTDTETKETEETKKLCTKK